MVNICTDPNYFTVKDGQMGLTPDAFGVDQVLHFRTAKGKETETVKVKFEKGKYPRAAKFLVRVQAGGGGSAGADSGTGVDGEVVARSGGAGGGYSEALLTWDQVPNSVTIQVGGGGKGGSGNAKGGAGGNSAFGSLVTANGGNGSANSMKSGTTQVAHSGTAGPKAGKSPGFGVGGGAGGGCWRFSKNEGVSGEGGHSMMGRGGLQYAIDGSDPAEGFGGGAGGALAEGGKAVKGRDGRPGIVTVMVING